MLPNEIRAELKLYRIAIRTIAEEAGLAAPTVHRAISGKARCKKAEEAVAQALGRARLDIFPPNRKEGLRS